MNPSTSKSSGSMELETSEWGSDLTRLIMTLSSDPLCGLIPYAIHGNRSFHYTSDGGVGVEDIELLCNLASSYDQNLPFNDIQFKTIGHYISENAHQVVNPIVLSEDVMSRMRNSLIISARIGQYRIHDLEFNKTPADNHSYLENTDDILLQIPIFYPHTNIVAHRDHDWVHFTTVDLNHFLNTRNIQLRIERFNLSLADSIGYPLRAIKPIYGPSNSYDALAFSHAPPCQCGDRGYFPNYVPYKHFPLCRVSSFSVGNTQSCIVAMCYRDLLATYKIYPCISDSFLCENCVTCCHGKKYISCSALHRYVLSSLTLLPCHHFNGNYNITHCICEHSWDHNPPITRVKDYVSPDYKKGKSSKRRGNEKVFQFSFHFSLDAVFLRKYFHLTCLKDGFYSKQMSWAILFEQQIPSILSSNVLTFLNYFVNPLDFQNYLESLFKEYAETTKCFEHICIELFKLEKEMQERGFVENYEISHEEYSEFLKGYWKQIGNELFYNRCYDVVHLRRINVHLDSQTPETIDLGQVPHIENLSYLYSLLEFCKMKNPTFKSRTSNCSVSLALSNLNMKSYNRKSRYMEYLGYFLEHKRRQMFNKIRASLSITPEGDFSPRTEVLETLIQHLIDEQRHTQLDKLPLFVTHRSYSKVKCNCLNGVA